MLEMTPPSTRPRQKGSQPRNGRQGPISLPLVVAIGVAGLFIVGVAAWLSAGGGGAVADPGPVHVHGLGINPADGALFIATHSGLYRVGEGEQSAERVGDRRQDTMGFTVIGPDRFLGSGHPDIREAQEKDLPPHLGLIESTDAGESWDAVSLLGEADFHVLRQAGERVYGYDSSNDRLLVSPDQGRSWETLERPGPIVDLAVAPSAPARIVTTSAGGAEEGLFESRDGGRSWTRIGEAVGLLAWPTPAQLYLLTGDGSVLASADGGRRFESRGTIGGEPAALVASEPRQLHVALHDGTIKTSNDGGATWTVRSTP